jgi:hypothetical protein
VKMFRAMSLKRRFRKPLARGARTSNWSFANWV